MTTILNTKSKMLKPLTSWLVKPLIFMLLAVSHTAFAAQQLSDDEMRNSTELLAASHVAGIQTGQLDYLQRQNEQDNNQWQQMPVSLLKVSSQQTLIQDARRAAEDRNFDLNQQRWLEYRKNMMAKDPTVIWFYATN